MIITDHSPRRPGHRSPSEQQPGHHHDQQVKSCTDGCCFYARHQPLHLRHYAAVDETVSVMEECCVWALRFPDRSYCHRSMSGISKLQVLVGAMLLAGQ
jgi:hypothetical protein